MPQYKPDGTPETPEEAFYRRLAAEKAELAKWKDRHTIYPPSPPLDPFSTRYGYIEGRCNALRRMHPGKLCKCYPLKGHRRCKFHMKGWGTKRFKKVKPTKQPPACPVSID